MILVDTSIWIDHFHQTDRTLVRLLDAALVASHPMVIGELAVGRIENRSLVLSSLGDLPSLTLANSDEVLRVIEARQLHGRGLGFVDVCLLASTLLTPGAQIWTRDRRLAESAATLRIGYPQNDLST